MSGGDIREIAGYLRSCSAITATTPKTEIRFGWPDEIEKFPCIIITQVGGSDTGYLGYQSSTAGSRMRREEFAFQLDIISRSRKQTYDLADTIVPMLIASGACRKDSDIDDFDDTKKIYRKIQTFSQTIHFDD